MRYKCCSGYRNSYVPESRCGDQTTLHCLTVATIATHTWQISCYASIPYMSMAISQFIIIGGCSKCEITGNL